jgi:S1-C subfamily serine protease
MRILRVVCALAFALSFGACAPKPDSPDDRFVAAVHAVRPSVVFITESLPPDSRKDRGTAVGFATGIVVASGDWGSDILTVQHAFDQAWDVRVTAGKTKRVPAKIVAKNSDLDAAILRVPTKHLPVAQLGSVSDLKGEGGRELGLLGYPVPDMFQYNGLALALSVNSGRLSSLRGDQLELSMPIVPGESGGPVFIGDSGEIVGMAESRFDTEPSIGFALAIDSAKRFLHKYDAIHGL